MTKVLESFVMVIEMDYAMRAYTDNTTRFATHRLQLTHSATIHIIHSNYTGHIRRWPIAISKGLHRPSTYLRSVSRRRSLVRFSVFRFLFSFAFICCFLGRSMAVHLPPLQQSLRHTLRSLVPAPTAFAPLSRLSSTSTSTASRRLYSSMAPPTDTRPIVISGPSGGALSSISHVYRGRAHS